MPIQINICGMPINLDGRSAGKIVLDRYIRLFEKKHPTYKELADHYWKLRMLESLSKCEAVSKTLVHYETFVTGTRHNGFVPIQELILDEIKTDLIEQLMAAMPIDTMMDSKCRLRDLDHAKEIGSEIRNILRRIDLSIL